MAESVWIAELHNNRQQFFVVSMFVAWNTFLPQFSNWNLQHQADRVLGLALQETCDGNAECRNIASVQSKKKQAYFKIANAGHSVTLEDYSALHLVPCGASEPLWLDVQCLVSSPFLLCFMAFASLLQQWPQNAQSNAGQSWKTPDSSRVIAITVDLYKG